MNRSISRIRPSNAEPAATTATGTRTSVPRRVRRHLLALWKPAGAAEENSVHLPEQRVRVSVVIPARNEAENLPHVLPRIPAWVHEVLLVDGASSDNTVEVAKQLYPDIRVVSQIGRGKGAALRSGFAAATGEIIVMLDADGSTDPAEIPAFVTKLLAGADFVKGSRFTAGGGTADMSFHRKLGNWAFVLAVRVLFGGRYSDLCYGYNAFWARVLPTLALDGDGFEIETMMNVRALREGLRIAEVPSFEAPRVYGTSNLRALPDGLRVARTILHERLKPDAMSTMARRFYSAHGLPLRNLDGVDGARSGYDGTAPPMQDLIALYIERRKAERRTRPALTGAEPQPGERRRSERRDIPPAALAGDPAADLQADGGPGGRRADLGAARRVSDFAEAWSAELLGDKASQQAMDRAS